jgi:hypothetical protein
LDKGLRLPRKAYGGSMIPGFILWLLGVPLGLIVLLWLFGILG